MYQQCNGESIYSLYMNKYIWIHLCMYLEEQSENADKQKQKQEQRKKKERIIDILSIVGIFRQP